MQMWYIMELLPYGYEPTKLVISTETNTKYNRGQQFINKQPIGVISFIYIYINTNIHFTCESFGSSF